MNSEVLIIGGGVIGLSIARELHAKGVRDVTIVEQGRAGSEASWAAAGMLAPNIEADISPEFHRFGLESLELYPEFADALLDETSVDIGLDRSGTLCVAFNDSETEELARIYLKQRSKNVSIEHISGDDIQKIEPAISIVAREGLLYPNDWQVENRRLLTALRTSCENAGRRIVENVEVSQVLTDGPRVTGARTSAGTISANVTVLATGAWTSLIKIGDSMMPFAVRPVRGQMLSFETGERLLRRVVYSASGYLVPRSDARMLVGATVEDVGFDKSTTADGLDALTTAAIEIVPALGGFAVADRWAGLRPFAADGLPVIGDVSGFENLLVATAHYRNGILMAPLTAKIVAEKIVNGTDSEYFRFFGAHRFVPSVANVSAI